jgi:chromosome segregation ATPase
MKTLSVIGIIALAFVSGVSLYNWRGSRLELQALSVEHSTLSNKCQQASAQIALKDSAVETLQTKIRLQSEDAAALSNQLQLARLSLAGALENASKQAALLRSRDSEIDRLQKEIASTRDASSLLVRQLESQSQGRSETESSLTESRRQLADLGEKLNSSEAARARLLQQWNDLSCVRAQLRVLQAPQPQPGFYYLSSPWPRLVIQPDGTVVVASTPDSD